MITTTLRRRAAIAAIAAAAGLLAACSGSGSGSASSAARASATTGGSAGIVASSAAAPATTTSVAPRSTSAKPKPTTTPVHIQLKFSDGQTFGVGIPVIAFFSRRISDATALQAATTVRINDQPVTGGRWFFEPVSGHPGYPIEGDYRLEKYWPAHSKIFVDIAAKGLTAGGGQAYDDSLTLSFATGASHIATVSNATHKLTLVTDGKVVGRYPVSLGASNTPTARGTKVVMEKGLSICMKGPGYNECGIKDTQRLTYGGEYLHAAPWNCTGSPGCVGPADNIGSADSSNGCTNLRPDDAATLYSELRIGDVVNFPDANGPKMTMGAGYGDWNVSWGQWLTGGDVDRI